MTYDPEQHRRRSIRLKDYDYSEAGAYFITICTHDKKCLFGDVHDGMMQVNDAGRMIQTVWNELPSHYPGVDIDAFITMPNHVHGIILLNVGAGPRACPDEWQLKNGQPQGVAPTLSLPDVVYRFKSLTTHRYIIGVKQNGWAPFTGRLWHRNYYEHIIRNEKSLEQIRNYIEYNASKWDTDEENPKNLNAGN